MQCAHTRRPAGETTIGRGVWGAEPPITPIKRNTAKKGREEKRRMRVASERILMRARRATCETRIERGVWGAAAPHNANKEKHSTERKRRSHQENNKIDRRARETRIGRGCGGRQPPITPIRRNTAKKGGEENRRGARGERQTNGHARGESGSAKRRIERVRV